MVNAQADYIDEFSEAGETHSLYGQWEYITQDGVRRTVNVYQYCAGGTCVLVPFDIDNHVLLTGQQAMRLFENLALHEALSSAPNPNPVIAYSVGALGQGSMVCDFVTPRIDFELKALAGQIIAKGVLPKVLPENGGKIVQAIYDAGESLGVVDKANVPILIIGAWCVGGDFLENFASSTLETCALLIQNIRNDLAYEGQFEDLMNCQSQALSRLGYAEYYSGNILTQHVETQAQNWFSQLWTAFLNWLSKFTGGNETQPTSIESNYEKVQVQLSVLQELNRTYAGIPTSAHSDFSDYKSRIELKAQETNSALANLNFALSRLNSRLSGYVGLGGLYTYVFNLSHEPRLDFNVAIANQSLASHAYQNAESLNSTYMFNSAIKSANAGMIYVTNGINAVGEEEAIPRQFYFSTKLLGLLAFLAVTVMILVGIGAYIRREGTYVG